MANESQQNVKLDRNEMNKSRWIVLVYVERKEKTAW